jgi:hypothetical protein
VCLLVWRRVCRQRAPADLQGWHSCDFGEVVRPAQIGYLIAWRYGNHHRWTIASREDSSRIDIGIVAWSISRLYKIDHHRAAGWTQYPRLDAHQSIEHLWVTDGSTAYTVPAIASEMLAPSERCRQWLTFVGKPCSAKAFLMQSSIEVVRCMWVPRAIGTRIQDEYLALRRAPHPQRQPKLRALPDGDCVLLLMRGLAKSHQPDSRTAQHHAHGFVKERP